MLSPAGHQARLSILIFHRVHRVPDPMFPGEVDAQSFDAICAWVARWFNVLPLDQAVKRLQDGSLPAASMAITFDDGYADNHDVAMPILQRHGLSATFFIATGYLDGGRMWNDTVIESIRGTRLTSLDLGTLDVDGLQAVPTADWPQRRAAVAQVLSKVKYLPPERRQQVVDRMARLSGAAMPDDLMMSTAQLQAMHRGGMQIGAHTVTHPILANLALEAARAEIGQSRDRLQALLQDRIGLFAYPNGVPGRDFKTEHPELVKQLGMDAAVTTASGHSTASTDVFQLRRFSPWDRSKGRFALRLMQNLRAR